LPKAFHRTISITCEHPADSLHCWLFAHTS
jgi:hypothetical protein